MHTIAIACNKRLDNRRKVNNCLKDTVVDVIKYYIIAPL